MPTNPTLTKSSKNKYLNVHRGSDEGLAVAKRISKILRDAEIGEFDFPLAVEQNICRLDVTVDTVVIMQHRQALDHPNAGILNAGISRKNYFWMIFSLFFIFFW